MTNKFSIHKIHSEVINLPSPNSLYIRKNNNSISLEISNKEGDHIYSLSGETGIDTIEGSTEFYVGIVNSFNITNYSSNKNYTITALKGKITIFQNDSKLVFNYLSIEPGPDIININGRVINININSLPIIQPVDIVITSGTFDNFQSPYSFEISQINSDVSVTITGVEIIISKTPDLINSVKFQGKFDANDINGHLKQIIKLTSSVRSLFVANEDCYISVVYNCYFSNRKIQLQSPVKFYKVLPYPSELPTYVLSTDVIPVNRNNCRVGRMAGSSDDFQHIFLVETTPPDYDNLVIKIYQKNEINDHITFRTELISGYYILNESIPNGGSIRKDVTNVYVNRSGTFAILNTMNAGVFLFRYDDIGYGQCEWELDNFFDIRGGWYQNIYFNNSSYVSEDGNTVIFSVIQKQSNAPSSYETRDLIFIYKRVDRYTWDFFQYIQSPTFTDAGNVFGNFNRIGSTIYPISNFGASILLSPDQQNLFIGDPGFRLKTSTINNLKEGIVRQYKYNQITSRFEFYRNIESPNKSMNLPAFYMLESFGCELKLSGDGSKLYIGSVNNLVYYDLTTETVLQIIETPSEIGYFKSFGKNFWVSDIGNKLYITAKDSNNGRGAVITYIRNNNGKYDLNGIIYNDSEIYTQLGEYILGHQTSAYTIVTSGAGDYNTNETVYSDAGAIIQLR